MLPFDASLLNELTADTNSLASVLTASLVDVDADVDALADVPFDASLLNEFTADTNSLASVLTASLVDVDADVLADVDALADTAQQEKVQARLYPQ
ncbi:hypothetical protein [Staphylococcus pseudintermedius]|uniref:hypothetical protein n=1 Tax=Staphylococcus pseudintermedius TaxID=283734 RepID=UPI00286D7A0C|nr:hypothetical protein [Staphylococcus pseudintermedius]WMZ81387.1 hypothetical protein QS418_12945 [Staphylococcus pseudintermedius]